LHGYTATSVRDLADGMGITGASLYNAFGDKRSLFRRSLDRYLDQTLRERIARFEGNLAPRQAIIAFFEEIVERSISDKERKGCLLVNSALVVAPHDSEFQRIVAKALKQLEAFFYRCVAAGQADGTIAKFQSAEDLAKLLLSVVLGIRVLARTRPDRALLEGLLRPVYALLGGLKSRRAGAAPVRLSAR
jgi:TetR/AcrR family transcriptional repressor of nem operon